MSIPSPAALVGAVIHAASGVTSVVHSSDKPLPEINAKAKAVFLVVVGDQDEDGKGDGKVDVTVHSALRVPFVKWLVISVTKNVPAEEALSVAQVAAAALPPPAAGFVSVVLGFMRVVVGAFKM